MNLKHCWLETSTQSGGMGAAGIDGLPMSPCYGTETEIKDHSSEPKTDCEDMSGCDEACINKEIQPGRSTGTWSRTNNCNTFVDKAIEKCCKKK
jgi:hypothetical protein